jgi:hypothetical protein
MTMTKMIQQMRSYMDETSKKSTFSLQELKADGMVFTSYFDSKDKAKSYARRYCDDESTIYIWKTNCIKIYDPIEHKDDDYSPEYDFSNMTVWKYGSGYLLVPPEDSEYFGNKYFHDGWWIKSQCGWFFKTQHYQWLMDNGAIISVVEEGDECEDEEYSTDLSSMVLWEYGKGYILEPPKESELFGVKYFHSGWWMTKQNGWFFKACEYDWLVDNGAILAEDEDQSVETDLSSMTLQSYGKGFLLMPTKTDSHYGEKYFHDGWWMPKQNGWFFKTCDYDWLVEHGAKSGTNAKTTAKGGAKTTAKVTELYEYDLDLSDMSITEYGLGYMLHTSESDSRYGQKYFMTGFWNPKQNGWFFKDKYFDELVSMGATVIKSEPEQMLQVSDTTELSSSITNDSFEYVHDDSEFMTSENNAVPKFIKYGKGWILKQDKHYKHSENDYFEGGWWMSEQNGWFFKKGDKQKFMKKHFEI